MLLDCFKGVNWLIYMPFLSSVIAFDMSLQSDRGHSYVRHDSSTCVTRLIHTCELTHSYVLYDPIICATWLFHMCDMAHSHVWHDFVCVTRLIHMCDMTHPYVWHDSFNGVTGLIHMCDMTHSHVWHGKGIEIPFFGDSLSHDLIVWFRHAEHHWAFKSCLHVMQHIWVSCHTCFDVNVSWPNAQILAFRIRLGLN